MTKRLLAFVGSFAVAVCGFLKAQWNQYNALGQFLFVIALAAIANDAAISYQYGKSMTTLHAFGFAIVAVTFCVLPDIATKAWGEGRRKAGFWLMLACVPFGLVAYQSHIGYGAGVRLGDMQQTGFQHAKLETANEALKSEVANMGMWRTQLAELKAQNAKFREKNNGWATTVEPTALQAMADEMNTKIANETARGGCKAKCEKLMADKAAILTMVANAKEENDLTRRIEATQRIIDGKSRVIADTGYTSSTVVNQNDTFAKLWNIVNGVDGETAIKPTAVQRDVTNTAMAGFASLAFMLCGPVLMIAAGLNRREGLIEIKRNVEAVSYPAPASVPFPAMTSVPVAANAMESIMQRRQQVLGRLSGMKQSRIDGSLIAAAA